MKRDPVQMVRTILRTHVEAVENAAAGDRAAVREVLRNVESDLVLFVQELVDEHNAGEDLVDPAIAEAEELTRDAR